MTSAHVKLGGSSVKCQACNKTVYPLEAVTLPDASFHKRCFKCAKCDCVVSPTSCAMFKQTPYCKVHFLEMFRERGTYAVFSDNYDPTTPAFRSRSGGPPSYASSSTAPSEPPALSSIVRCSSSSNEEAGSKLHPPTVSVASRLKKFHSADAASLPPPLTPINFAPTVTKAPTPAPEDEEPGAGDDMPSSGGLNVSLFDAIMKNDPNQLRNVIDEAGLRVLFEKNDKGRTAIELSFTTASIQCGRAMLAIVEEHLIQLRNA